MNKKGCFIKIVGVGTVLVAVLAYLIQSNSFENLLKPVLRVIDDDVTRELESKISFVKQTPEKDSLMANFKEYIENGPRVIGDDKNDFKKLLVSKILVFAQDSVIDSSELNEIKDLINLEVKNERSKEK
jgi:hypothetical protein